MWTLTIKTHFDAAHHLPKYVGTCSQIHGHRWNVDVQIVRSRLWEDGSEKGMVVDFKRLKKIISKFLPDHQDLNLIIENPTAENIAKSLFHCLKNNIEATFNYVKVTSLTVWETPDCGCTYSEEGV